MSKFKPGDKVVRTGGTYGHEGVYVGGIYTVRELRDDPFSDRLYLEDLFLSYNPDYFALVEPARKPFTPTGEGWIAGGVPNWTPSIDGHYEVVKHHEWDESPSRSGTSNHRWATWHRITPNPAPPLVLPTDEYTVIKVKWKSGGESILMRGPDAWVSKGNGEYSDAYLVSAINSFEVKAKP